MDGERSKVVPAWVLRYRPRPEGLYLSPRPSEMMGADPVPYGRAKPRAAPNVIQLRPRR